MLQSVRKLQGTRVRASDGEIGEVREVYFDDERWGIRYLVVDTGGWLSGRRVLISPYAVEAIDWADDAVAVRLTREQVENSPGIDTDRPVSRQQEAEIHRYYGYPLYWPYTTMWPWGAMPVVVPPDPAMAEAMREQQQREHESADSHLRSSKEVIGYHIQATDEPVGHVADFLFDEDSWGLSHFVVDTRNWLPGKHVLVPTTRIRDVSWPERTVAVDLDRSEIESSPEYDPAHPPRAAYGAAERRL